MRNNQAILALRDIFDHQRCNLTRKGEELSSNDKSTAKEVMFQWLLVVVETYHLDPNEDKHRITSLCSDILGNDLMPVLDSFAKCVALIQLQKSGFKALLSVIVPSLWKLIRDDVDKMLHGDVFAAGRLYQIFSYCNRLSLRDIDLQTDQEFDYLAHENELDNQYLPQTLIRPLNKIIRKWFARFSIEHLPKHGPGGVAGHGRTSLDNKYRDLTKDPLLAYSFDPFIHEEDRILSHLSRYSHTIFVPKSYKSFRTISMEPTTLMFYQQAVLSSITEHVYRDYDMRSRFGWKDQSRNVRLARLGSTNRDYSTIDLSAASDLVSWKLVKLLFRGTPLLRYLVSTRSHSTVLPSGRTLVLKKFAPMGSALCFPIETIIFAAVCEFVMKEHGFSTDYSVYGDDIIVPTFATDDVIYVLEALSFKVNTSKSFTDPNCWFRESCGGDFVDGHEITPMRISRTFDDDSPIEKYTSDRDMANEAYRRGFSLLRLYFINRTREKVEPLFGPNHLLSDMATNFHLPSRFNEFLQRTEVRAKMVRSSYASRNDHIAYQHWLLMNDSRSEVIDPFISKTGSMTVRLKKAWVEKP